MSGGLFVLVVLPDMSKLFIDLIDEKTAAFRIVNCLLLPF